MTDVKINTHILYHNRTRDCPLSRMVCSPDLRSGHPQLCRCTIGAIWWYCSYDMHTTVWGTTHRPRQVCINTSWHKTGPPRDICGRFRPQRVQGLHSRHFEVAQNELFARRDQHRHAGELPRHSPYRQGTRMVLQECRTIWSPGPQVDLGNGSARTTEEAPAYLDMVSQGTTIVQEVLNDLKKYAAWMIHLPSV